MTTTTFDCAAKVLTSDSRWSVHQGHLLVYIDDDVGFDKIESEKGLCLLFAGDSAVIDQWKQWLRSGAGTSVMPSPKGIAILIVEISSGNVLGHYGQEIAFQEGDPARPTAIFAGSGAYPAANCWQANRCAHRAIDSAKLADIFTGGNTKFFELSNSNTNVTNTISASGLRALFKEKGMVMYLNGQSSAVPYKQAAANDVQVAELGEKIASGQLNLSAPCDAMFMTPTTEQIEELRDVLTPFFGK